MIPATALSRDPISVGLLTPHNPFDRRCFSGTAHFATHALARHPGVRLRILGSHKPPKVMDRLLRRPAPRLAPDAPLDLGGIDAVVGLVASAHLDALAQDHPGMPYVHVTDATPDFLRDAYGWAIPRTADAMETRVVQNALSTVYSSDAMADRAAGDLGLDSPAVDVAPFGVNFEALPRQRPEKPSQARLELLFVGLDWLRKGGDIAVAALDCLLRSGNDAHLTIVGHCPKRHLDHPAITYAGFLNKNRPSDAAKLADLYVQAHVMLVPSRADCTPMVVGEAMAHGTPVIATDTGGVATLLGPTGRLMPQTAAPNDWAEEICTLTGSGYAAAMDASFNRAQHDLSWDGWADRVVTVLAERLADAPAVPALGQTAA